MEKEEQGIPLDSICGGAVGIVLARMDSHPEEFFADEDKWKFIYKDYFRDAMTETEKGMIFDKIKTIRRSEFSQAVLTTLVERANEDEDEYEHERNNPAFGRAPVRISKSEVAMAHKLGMTPLEYAKQKAKI